MSINHFRLHKIDFSRNVWFFWSCHVILLILTIFLGIFTVKMKRLAFSCEEKAHFIVSYLHFSLRCISYWQNLVLSFYLLKSKHINSRISISDLKSNRNGSKTVYIVSGMRFTFLTISYRIAHAGILHTIPILCLIIEFMHDRIGETIARRLFVYVVKIQMKRHTAPHELRFS